MDVTILTQLISQLGFPIVCCGCLFWLMNKQDKRHSEEINNLRESYDANTDAINRLIDKLEEND